jgi:cardiolipin synthase
MDWLIQHVLRERLGMHGLADAFVWLVALAFAVNVLFAVRVVFTKGSRPTAALAWITALFALPLLGAALYVIIGENRVGSVRRRRHARIVAAAEGALASVQRDPRVLAAAMSHPDMQLARLGEASGAPQALGGNLVQLTGDPEEQVRWMESDIDAAERSVDLLFYIWECDATGERMAAALERAARRGVHVRLLVDGIGSRAFLRSQMRRRLEAAGVRVVEALPATLVRILFARIDIRNHRKLVIVDGTVAQTGSRNVADPDFKSGGRLGPKEPYVDSWMRIRGPAVRDLKIFFLEDWELDTGHRVAASEVVEPLPLPGGIPAQVLPSGPNFENSVVRELIQAAIQLARREIVFSTPYFIPDSPTIAAMAVAARRGIRVTLILPRANDSLLAAWASRANYALLLDAGVELWEHRRGFLHSKTVSVDDEFAIVTTANLDRRSYEINFETSVVVYDDAFTRSMRRLQHSYLADSDRIDPNAWARRGAMTRFTENLANLVSPLL